MAVVTMRQLLEAGVHFGHQTRRWNPKMKRFIYGERNGIYIIDLQKTTGAIERTYAFLRDSVAKGGTVLFVGTKKQAQESIKDQATRVGMPYVNFRWLGGMLTNFTTIYKRLQRLKELEAMVASDATEVLPKKEVLKLKHEHEKLERNLGGIRDMTRVPSAIWVVDTRKEHIAVTEARKLGIPVVAILDTNCDPDEVDYPIPGNDDAIRSGSLLTRIVADAIAEGLRLRSVYGPGSGSGTDTDPKASPVDEEPLAEWERELLESESQTAAPAAEAKTDTKPAAKAPAKGAAAKPAAEARAKVGDKDAAKPAAKDEGKADASSEAKPEAKPEAKSQAKPAARAADAKSADSAPAKGEAKPAAKGEAKADAEAKGAAAKAAAKSGNETEAKGATNGEAKSDPKGEASAEAEAKGAAAKAADAKHGDDAEAKSEAKADAKADANADAKADAKADANADAKLAAKAEGKAKAADAEPAAEADAPADEAKAEGVAPADETAGA